MALETKLEDNSGSCTKLSILPIIYFTNFFPIDILDSAYSLFGEKLGQYQGKAPNVSPKVITAPPLCTSSSLTPFQWSHLDTKLLHSVKDF